MVARAVVFQLTPYTPGKPIEEVERELGLKDVVKLASNENCLGPSPRALDAIREALPKIHMYPDNDCFYLRRELAAFLGCSPENLLVAAGSDHVLRLLAETFLSPGDEVIMAHPTFSEYEFMSRIMEAECIYVPVREDFAYDLEGMAARVSGRTKLIFICSPNNPTGTIVKRGELEGFLASLPPHVLVILDEAYGEYVTDPEYPDSLSYVAAGRNVVVLRTFSKIYGLAGLRIGYAIAREDLISLMRRVQEPFNVNTLAQVAARAALADQEHVARSREMVAAGKEYLARAFERLGLRYVPTQANFVFVDVGKDSREVFGRLLREGVITRTGDIFGYPTFLRVTIGTPEENARFVAALEKVLSSWS